eukprot:SAG25_NODE_4395_length_825_cov_1.895317_2_plen_43_part_01
MGEGPAEAEAKSCTHGPSLLADCYYNTVCDTSITFKQNASVTH